MGWTGMRLGHRLAPPRFLLFLALLAMALGAAVPMLGLERGVMVAFDGAAAIFLLSLVPLFRAAEADRMRASSRENDANRTLLLGVTAVVMLVVLVAVGAVVREKTSGAAIALILATLTLTWLFSNTIYALHYAHLFYRDDDGADAGGLDFPGCDEPDYWDFLYFSLTLGMAFATSDVQLCARNIRRVVLGQTLAAFVFNLGVIAFAVGVVGS